MEITMLGTGNALVTECYNTCFVIKDEGKNFMVDAGGGSTVLTQLKRVNIDYCDIHEIFVTHKHVDHIMGIIWMVRMIGQAMNKGTYVGEANIYGHDEVIDLIETISKALLQKKETAHLGERIHLIKVEDGETRVINDREVTFFDIHSTKAKQFGFLMQMDDGKRLVCCGDEPYNEHEYKYVINADWMLHEAFCLFSEADKFHPYEKHHSTVKDAAELAEDMNVKNLLLYHTEDKNIKRRKELYFEEGSKEYHGHLYIPDDLETIMLDL
ncbi:MAG: MBL fold metallo-hydrolase [Lachnospiraceae bacterium]|nr:MBL fold metallo-hydrolase [Lachnospiraceae bacterium]